MTEPTATPDLTPLRRKARFWISIGFLFSCSWPVIQIFWGNSDNVTSWLFVFGILVSSKFPTAARVKEEKVSLARNVSQVVLLVSFFGLVFRCLFLLNGAKLDPFVAGFLCLWLFADSLGRWAAVEEAEAAELKSALTQV